ncbi:efflux transporter outer membrane subunit [Ferrovibrio sp.]|uniref:efflux transporter outer membrane subunit n=1 Tax=Ferrovibrio sp. TaxID=1917215 RepID=UPI0035AECC63
MYTSAQYRPLLALPLLFGLAACDVSERFTLPSLSLPAAWEIRSAEAGRAATNNAGNAVTSVDTVSEAWPDPDWWRGFGSQELAMLMLQAEAGNHDLAAAVARIEQAEASLRVAGAALLPTLSASGNAARNWSPPASSTSGSVSTRVPERSTRNSFSTGLTAGYQVDLFGGNRAGSEAAAARLSASRYDRETVRLTLHANLAASFFQLLSLRDRIRLAEDTLRNAEDVLTVLQRQQQLGVASDLEVAQQRNSVASQRATLPALRQSEYETLTAIALLLGRPPQGFRVQTQSLNDLALPPVRAGLPSGLLERRPDLRQAEASLYAANRDLAVAKAARLPTLSLTASGSLQSNELRNLLDPQSALYSLASSILAPIFQGGRLEAQEDLSRARLRELAETYAKTAVTAFGDVEDALNANNNAAQRAGFATEAYDQAQDAYRIVDARFRAGTVPFINLLDSQRAVFQANDTLVQAQLARYTALVDLYKALGGGWQQTPE